MDDSPLNYSGLQYDGAARQSPHAPGEIWSATNHSIARAERQVRRRLFPSDDEPPAALREGERVAADLPGQPAVGADHVRRPAAPVDLGSTMVDSRDAMLAGDLLRFGGANQVELWDGLRRPWPRRDREHYQRRRRRPAPGWISPVADDEATVTFAATDVGASVRPTDLEVFVGDYEARRRRSPTPSRHGHRRHRQFVPARTTSSPRRPATARSGSPAPCSPGGDPRVPLRFNLASGANGAIATGDGERLDALIDDTESTQLGLAHRRRHGPPCR